MTARPPTKPRATTRMSSSDLPQSSRTPSVAASRSPQLMFLHYKLTLRVATSLSCAKHTTRTERPTKPTTGRFCRLRAPLRAETWLRRYHAKKSMDKAAAEEPWFGIEQVRCLLRTQILMDLIVGCRNTPSLALMAHRTAGHRVVSPALKVLTTAVSVGRLSLLLFFSQCSRTL